MANLYRTLARNIGLSSAVYSVGCFAFAAAVYLAILLTGHAVYRDSSGEVVDAIIPISAVFVSSLFVGAVTSFMCLGGLLGVWLVSTGGEAGPWRHIIAGTLFAIICSSVFFVGSSLGNDYLVLRAILVTAISLMIGMLVKLHAPRTPSNPPVKLTGQP